VERSVGVALFGAVDQLGRLLFACFPVRSVRSGIGLSVPQDPAGEIPNGPDAAAILAAGMACTAVGILALVGDASEGVGDFLNFYDPVGRLSGVTTVLIIIWIWLDGVVCPWSSLAAEDGSPRKGQFGGLRLVARRPVAYFPPFMDMVQERQVIARQPWEVQSGHTNY
jgi:hypothetical protein